MNKPADICSDPDRLEKVIEATLIDYKAVDVLLLDLRHCNAFTDLMLLSTGTSTRHVANLGNQVIKTAKQHNCEILSVEGQQHNEWIAIDLGVIVVHLMLREIRDFYAIEKIWSV